MKPSPAIVACGADAAQPSLTRSLPRFRGADSWRPAALAALLLACVLLPAGFFSHEHDDGDPGGHDHDCITCCLPHDAAVASDAAPSLSTPELTTRAAEKTRRGSAPSATRGTGPTRGPPA